MADITKRDLDETAKQLGIKIPGFDARPPARVKPAELTDDDIAETIQSIGIDVGSLPARGASPANSDVQAGGNGEPARITVRPPPPVAQTPSIPAGFARSFAEGVPILGPLANKANAATFATLSPLAPGDTTVSQAPDWATRYSENLGAERARSDQFSKENPGTALTGNLTGAVASMIPAAGTRLGAWLLGMRGPSLGARTLAGTVGGTTIGATDAALRGDNIVHGAMIGGAGGAAGPLLGQLARGATNWFTNNVLPRVGELRDFSNTAIKALVNAVGDETPGTIAAAKDRMGPAGFLADVNPQLTDMAGALADMPGTGKTVVREAFAGRSAAQPDRITKALDKSMGKSTNIEQLKNYIAEDRALAADPLYEQWRSMQVHPTDAIKALIPRLEKSGAFNMAEELSGISGRPIDKAFFTTGQQKRFPTTEAWDYVKRGLDRRIDQAYNAGDKTLARELVTLKHNLIDEIDKTDAGKVWNKARSEFAERSALLDNIEAGRDTFLGGRSGITADELREELRGLKGPELAARIVGARNAVDSAMRASMHGDTSIRNKLLSPENRDKLKLLLGDRADKLIRTLEQEHFLGNQEKNVIGNVMTGASAPSRSARVKAMLPDQPMPWNPDITQPLTLLPPSLREEFRPSSIAAAYRGQRHDIANNQLARALVTPQSSPSLDRLLTAIGKEAARRREVDVHAEKLGNALTALISGPATTTARRQYFPQR